jgi:hypothetical protein
MRYALLTLLLVLAIAFDLAIFIAASDEPLGAFDPHRPATLVPVVMDRLRSLGAQVREFDAGHFLDVLAAPYRERLRHEGPSPAPAP